MKTIKQFIIIIIIIIIIFLVRSPCLMYCWLISIMCEDKMAQKNNYK